MTLARVLIVEDEEVKLTAIRQEVEGFFQSSVTVDVVETFGSATRNILQQKYDLIIVDLLIPRRSGDEPSDVSEELIEHLSESDVNRHSTVVAISRFGDVVQQRRGDFSRAAIFLIDYSDRENWKSCLRVCMQRVSFRRVYDFVVVCALEEERAAFEAVNFPGFVYGGMFAKDGLDSREVRLGALIGVCVLQPHLGLVDASIIATRALHSFGPKLICMSGICGGFEEEVPLCTLLVSDVTWEHQAGKWRGDTFEIRSFQERLSNDLKIILSQIIQRDPELKDLQSTRYEVAIPPSSAILCPTVSGSAVIASDRYADEIRKQHGKVSGVDMEVFGLYRSAALHGEGVRCFAAKAVVDFANEQKNDGMHVAGAVLSARFVVKAIHQILSDAG